MNFYQLCMIVVFIFYPIGFLFGVNEELKKKSVAIRKCPRSITYIIEHTKL